ncbi:MAG: FMN-binding protein, partial [Paracoccus sp. (in: a-proteobacteria)]|nr:FMN-binding protein [Paracoccus sp. (in: a-proteobacteria)]
MLHRFLFHLVILVLGALIGLTPGSAQQAAAPNVLSQYLAEVAPGDLVPGADAFGQIRPDIPVAPVLAGDQTLGYAFITSDFVGTTGYSGKPIHTMVAVSPDAVVLGVRLVKHSEPIVLIGIPEARMTAVAEGYAGLDLVAEAKAGGSAHDLNIISGATVTVMVMDDSIVRAGLRVARALGLGGLADDATAAGPSFRLNPEATAPGDWETMLGDGTVRRLLLTTQDVNEAFALLGDPRSDARALTAPPEAVFIDMQAALVSVPDIGRKVLGEAEYTNLSNWLDEGDSAVLIGGLGPYSFKGSGYVRGGIFDRIQLIQDDNSVRFRDRQHRRASIALDDAPAFTEVDLFRIPADSGFDPARPFRIQLLVHRDVAAIEKLFTTFDLGYQLPDYYLEAIPAPAPEPAPEAAPAASAVAAADQIATQDESAAQAALWKRIWEGKKIQNIVLAGLLSVLTGAFFFQ